MHRDGRSKSGAEGASSHHGFFESWIHESEERSGVLPLLLRYHGLPRPVGMTSPMIRTLDSPRHRWGCGYAYLALLAAASLRGRWEQSCMCNPMQRANSNPPDIHEPILILL